MATFNDILAAMQGAIDDFNATVPASQKSMLNSIQLELKGLDLNSQGNVKTSVANLKLAGKIKSDLQNLILTDKYLGNVQDFVDQYLTIAQLQNQYFSAIESEFKPGPLLEEIKQQAVDDTVKSLGEQGIGASIAEEITQILQSNITTGGSYAQLNDQLRTALTDQEGNPGLLTRYSKQITTDAINQYSAQYTKAVSDDLGYEWFAYQGSDIQTTRPFCDAMTDFTFFNVSEIPSLLKAQNLYYTNKKTGQRELVPIYAKTGLPNGMIPGTNPSNFQINRGGYNCGHQIRPVSALIVPQYIKDRVNGIPNINAGVKDTKELYTNSKGVYNAERTALHEKIISGILKKGSTKEGTIYALGGAPANGKSTLIKAEKIPTPDGVLVMDPDEIKKQLPEYTAMVDAKDPRAAAFVHEESSFIAKETVKRALAEDFDLVTDGVGDGKLTDVQRKVNQYHAADKRVRADYVTLDTDLSVKLAAARAAQTGREVPKEYILEMNQEISKLVPELVKDKTFDELYLWDTNEQAAPRLILSQIDGKTVIADQDLYKRFLNKANG